jgi:hypothetical protein
MKRLFASSLIVGGMAVLAATVSVLGQDTPQGFVESVRRATAGFAGVEATTSSGYAQFLDCVSEPGRGAMGIHFLNGALVEDGRLDVYQPEALMYEPQPDGRLELLGAEYIVFQEPWDTAHPQPPALMGQDFHLVRSPNRYGVPAFYQLHVWAWRDNPAGPFNSWNPNVTCPGPAAGAAEPHDHH